MVYHLLALFYRPKNCFLLTVTVTLIFLMYQLFSVGQLGRELNRRKHSSQLQTNFRAYEKADAIMPHKSDDEIKYKNKLNEYKPGDSNLIRGALVENYKFYTPSESGTFKCIYSKEEIDFSMLNDNYCDCSDFSDEPSTSACNFGRFHCTYQSKTGPADIISYKVNDGICDCCDGSDEWEHITLPIHTGLPEKKQTGVYQVPCSFRCLK